MRRVLARWQRSGLTLREFAEKRGIPLSTLTWWRVFRRAGDEEGNGDSGGERGGVHRSATAGEGSRDSRGSGDRPAQRASGAGAGGSRHRHAAAGAPGPANDMLTLPASVRVFVARGATELRQS